MTRWCDGPMLGLDLETTSAEPENARVVQAALVEIGASRRDGAERRVQKRSLLVNPGVEIPQEAIEVHGITNERAQAEGVEPWEALVEVAAHLGEATRRRTPVVIMNAPYDLTVLDREFRRREWSGTANRLPGLLVVDPLAIERHLDRYRPKRVASHSLEDCCRVWKVPLEGVAHDAAFDAIAGCRLAWRLATAGRVIRRTRDAQERQEFIELTQRWEAVRHDLDALQEYQRELHAENAARLEMYFRAGDPQKGVPAMPGRVCPRDWPVVPVGTDWGDPTPVVSEGDQDPRTPEWTI